MSGVNKVFLIGHLGRDPEVRKTNEFVVANLALATSESWKDKKTGERQEKTEWHRVVMYGRLAEICEEWLKKGSQIYVEGRLQTRKWERDGQDVYTTEIIGREMTMLGGRESKPPKEKPKERRPEKQEADFNDDIPF